MSEVALVLLYSRESRNSINVLVGSIESAPGLRDVDIRLPPDYPRLRDEIVRLAGRRVIVGVSMFTPQLPEMRTLARRIRRQFGREVLLVAGGPHPTADPMSVLLAGFDVVAVGEAEQTIRDLAAAVRDGLAWPGAMSATVVLSQACPPRAGMAGPPSKTAGRRSSHGTQQMTGSEPPIAAVRVGHPPSGVGEAWRAVRGLAYLDAAGQLHRTPRRPTVSLDDFPPFPIRRRKCGPIEITRGCPFACGYCQTAHLFGTKPRHRSVASVARWVAEMAGRGRADVRVLSPNAFSYGSPDGRSVNLAAMEELLAAMRREVGPGGRIYFGSFPSEVRPEHVSEAAIALVRRYADNDNLIIGAQTGSQRLLDACHRGHTVADVVRAVALTRAAGLGANVDFIFGLPDEADADVAETIALIEQLAAMGTTIRAHTFLPLPQTPFAAARPGRLRPVVRKLLGRLQHEGKLIGLWWRQQRTAARIARPRTGKD
ncbi:MAG: TIGR04013 family B12-binding domain/radical SAM domain-containing protein [Phycisphaerae bacterium]|nr:TIGR04013 family B12-binding domain/radical SAM domain-containing protein [Phycisphaerae bacterium]